jgi:hypothetical protein
MNKTAVAVFLVPECWEHIAPIVSGYIIERDDLRWLACERVQYESSWCLSLLFPDGAIVSLPLSAILAVLQQPAASATGFRT